MKVIRVSLNHRVSTVRPLRNNVTTIVFCRPTLSARKPIRIRETAFTPFDRAMSKAPVSVEYARDEANKEV
jgi:hypothetical protein